MKKIIDWIKNYVTFKDLTIKICIFVAVIVFCMIFTNKEVQETLFNFFN